MLDFWGLPVHWQALLFYTSDMKPKILLPVVGIGLAIGFYGASLVLPPVSRVERIAQLFEDLCIQRAKGLQVDPLELGLRAENWRGPSYGDPASLSFINLTDRGCDISTNHPFALSESEAQELKSRASALRDRHFPDLALDPGAQLGSIHIGWAEGTVATPDRWGMFFFAYPDWGDSAGSVLIMGYPPKTEL
ncbi:MAG: hypothetical protein JXQ89_22375 [Pelagimonas sp.]